MGSQEQLPQKTKVNIISHLSIADLLFLQPKGTYLRYAAHLDYSSGGKQVKTKRFIDNSSLRYLE